MRSLESAAGLFLHTQMLFDTIIHNSAVKQLIVINRIQNKSLCLHNIYVFVCTIYIYVYINTHTSMYIIKKKIVYILNIFIYKLYEYNLISKYILYLYLYIHIIHIHAYIM